MRRHTGNRDALSAAIVAGLLRYPAEIARHGDALIRAGLADPRFAVLIDAQDGGVVLETEALGTILAARGLAAPGPEEYAALRFGFLADGVPEDQARADGLPALAGAAAARDDGHAQVAADGQRGFHVFLRARDEHANRHHLVDGGVGGVAAPVGG